MKRLVLAAALAAVAATAVPAGADVTVCPGGATVRHGDVTVGHSFDCVTVDTP